MKEQRKKQLIILLLAISCLISGYMLLFSSKKEPKHLNNLGQVDSLLQQQFSIFDIPRRQIRIETVTVDSIFNRKKYSMHVSPHLSKTQFHAVLNELLHQYGVTTPAEVSIPDKTITMRLMYHQTIIRTITMRTDDGLQLISKQTVQGD